MSRLLKKIVAVLIHLLLMYFVYNMFIPEHSIFKKGEAYTKKQGNIARYEDLMAQPDVATSQTGYHQRQETPSEKGRARSSCIDCHTFYPHKKNIATRAFYNMHAIRISCLTCHIKKKDKSKVKTGWFDVNGNYKVNGREIESAQIASYLIIDTFYTIIEKGIKDHDELKDKYKISIALRDDIRCKNCHSSRGKQYLKLQHLGYSEKDIKKLRNLDETTRYDRKEKWIYDVF